MENEKSKSRWIFALLLIPFISGILALCHWGFVFKAGVAGGGILIMAWIYGGQLSRNKDVYAIFGAFLFSIVGDWFLSNRNGETIRFILGIAMFFVAHIGYLSFGLINGKLNRVVTLTVVAVSLALYFFMLNPGIDNIALRVAILLYLFISCFSLGAAFGIEGKSAFKWLYLFGISMVLFSDVVIALREFVKYKDLDFLVLPTYYLAQISITAALISRKVFNENKVIRYKF